MASRRAAATLVRTCAPSAREAIIPRPRAGAAPPSQREYHGTRVVRHALRHHCSAPCARRQLLVKTVAGGPATTRAYSTDPEGSPSKIWDFEAMQKLITTSNPSVTIIDVREPHELQQTGRIPGALNVPVTSAPDSWHITDDEFEDRHGHPRPARDAELVFYCKAGVRSRAAAGLARDAGWTKVGEYPGSWTDWFERGGKVERS